MNWKIKGQPRFVHVDEYIKSTHSKDANKGEVVVNRRVLLSGENEPDQRRILFCTRCKCEDKFCDVIIDGRSTNNMVLEEMVTKLKLKR